MPKKKRPAPCRDAAGRGVCPPLRSSRRCAWRWRRSGRKSRSTSAASSSRNRRRQEEGSRRREKEREREREERTKEKRGREASEKQGGRERKRERTTGRREQLAQSGFGCLSRRLLASAGLVKKSRDSCPNVTAALSSTSETSLSSCAGSEREKPWWETRPPFAPEADRGRGGPPAWPPSASL